VNVSAVVVTRGDVDLAPIVETIPADYDLVVWNNSERPFDARIFGRYLAALEARGDVVYFQDDDIIFTEHAALREAWEPGVLVANMDDAWIRAGGYEDVRLLGAGSLAEPYVLWDAISSYLSVFPLDEAFLYEVDFVVGVLAPSVRVDLGYELRREIVWRETQLSMQEWQFALKSEFMRRAREIRDGLRERRSA
jgi:hypothetical protein